MITSGSQVEQLNIKMAQISSSNKPEDIATLAYIWGFPLVSMQRQFNFVTSPNVHGLGRGHDNAKSCARTLVDASFTVTHGYPILYYPVRSEKRTNSGCCTSNCS